MYLYICMYVHIFCGPHIVNWAIFQVVSVCFEWPIFGTSLRGTASTGTQYSYIHIHTYMHTNKHITYIRIYKLSMLYVCICVNPYI